MQRAKTFRRLVIAAGMMIMAGCGGSEAGDDRADVVRAPERAGEVYEVAGAADRAESPAVLLAFVTGTHVMVVDGQDAFAGMTRLRGSSTADGGLLLPLRGTAEATLLAAGDSMSLRFSGGEQVTLRPRGAGETGGGR